MSALLQRVRRLAAYSWEERRRAVWRQFVRPGQRQLPSGLNSNVLRYEWHLWLARLSASDLYRETEPLVSVLIPTFDRADLLVERALASVLRQTYRRFEVVIVGDACTDHTRTSLERLGDRRVRFHNLSSRGRYPEDPYHCWLVAGSIPANKALTLARGRWVASLDDDDEFSDDHIDVLLSACLRRKLEFAYGIMDSEVGPNVWKPIGSYPPELGRICNSSVLYGSHLRFFKYDVGCWRDNEPNDWNLWKRMWGSGVRMGFVDRVVGRHFLEHRPAGR